MKKVVFAALALLSTLTSANDLTIPGERWLGEFDGFRCAAYGSFVATPASYDAMGLEITQMTTDMSLDNGLIKATYLDGSSECRYSAVVFADNSAKTIELVESKAYAVDGVAECSAGKELLDKQFKLTNYIYWAGRVLVMVQDASAPDLCGALKVGISFKKGVRIDN